MLPQGLLPPVPKGYTNPTLLRGIALRLCLVWRLRWLHRWLHRLPLQGGSIQGISDRFGGLKQAEKEEDLRLREAWQGLAGLGKNRWGRSDMSGKRLGKATVLELYSSVTYTTNINKPAITTEPSSTCRKRIP